MPLHVYYDLIQMYNTNKVTNISRELMPEIHVSSGESNDVYKTYCLSSPYGVLAV